MKPLSLYLHIPFCVRKCAYCDFPSYPNCLHHLSDYVNALISEITSASRRYPDRIVNTIFFGGGTPSLLSGAQMQTLMDTVRACFRVAEDAEISMEANPGTLTPENLIEYRASGINRLSIGVQTMNDRLLHAIGRIHTRSDAIEAVRLARSAGFDNINLDLMYGLPGQSEEDFAETLRDALRLNVEHLSMYSLIVEEGTPLCEQFEAGKITLPDDEATLNMQHAAAELLRRHDMHRYEISNYAKPGFECRHNMVYWHRGEYLGLGCAAHSLMEEMRFSNTPDLYEYLSGVREFDRQPLDFADVLEETVMLSLRTVRGMDMDEYRMLCGVDYPVKKRIIDRLMREDMALLTAGRLSLTERGMDVLNAVIEALI